MGGALSEKFGAELHSDFLGETRSSLYRIITRLVLGSTIMKLFHAGKEWLAELDVVAKGLFWELPCQMDQVRKQH